MNKPDRQQPFNLGLTVIFISLSFIMLIPFLWMLITAFKPDDQIHTLSGILPEHLTVQPFIDAWHNVNFPLLYGNSLFVAATGTISTILICSMAGYAFAKYEFKFKNLMFILILSTMMIPIQVTMIPLYLFVTKLGWQNTYQGILFPQIASAYGVFLMKQFMETIPSDLIDSARIDGASEFRIFRQIMFPLTKPVVATLGIFTFMWSWDSFLWPLIVIDSNAMKTIPLGIAMVTQMAGRRILYNQLMAISILGMVPVVVAFFSLQKYFVRGVVMSGIKG